MTQKSPNLTEISKESVEAEVDTEKRKFPRLCVTHEQFRLQSNGKIFSVADVSASGFALRLLDHEDAVHFPVGGEVTGVLNLQRERFTVRAKIRNLTRDRVGAEFDSLSDEVKRGLEVRLAPQYLGESLRPMPSSGIGVLWYEGVSGTRLFLWRSADGSFHRFALWALGQLIQWDSESGLSTGLLEPSGAPALERGAVLEESVDFNRDSKPDPRKLLVAKTILLSSNLPKDLAGLFARRLRWD